MKLALIGYGQMGYTIEKIALARGHHIPVTVDPVNPDARYRELTADILMDCDVCIEFTLPEAVLNNIKHIAEAGKPMVIGTTGWYNQLDNVRQWVNAANTALIYAPNFSLGVNLFYKMVACAADIINKFDNYDISGLEIHHNKKADSPSGTAKKIVEILLKRIDRKKAAFYNKLDRRIESDELHFASIRCGAVPGMHKVLFDSEADSIELSHTARNRVGFAFGSVLAAEWIVSRKGTFTIDDFLEDLLEKERQK